MGPLSSKMLHYKAHFTGSMVTNQWDLRPLGFLPLKSLSVSVTSLEARHNRELCFQVLQVPNLQFTYLIMSIMSY